MGHGGDLGQVFQQAEVHGRGLKVVVADHGAHGLAAELAIFRRVDLLVQVGLVDFGRVEEVVQQLVLGHVEHFHDDVLAEVRPVGQQLEPAPGGFQGLEIRMVQNAVHEGAEAAVDIRDHAVDHALVDLFVRVDGLEHFLHNRADAEARVFIAVVLRGDVGLADDLREQ